jgi:hypothetical protein
MSCSTSCGRRLNDKKVTEHMEEGREGKKERGKEGKRE